MSDTNTSAVDHATASALLEAFHATGTPALFIGPPGIGKTAMVEQFASTLGGHTNLVTIHGSHYGPAQLMGIGVPDIAGNMTRFLAPHLFHRIWDAKEKGESTVLFIDELATAAPAVQAMLLQLTDERRIGGHVLPDDTYVVLASNNKEDKGPGFFMTPVLTNRLAVVQTGPPTANEWAAWAMGNGVDPVVIAYIMANPGRLFDYDPARYINPTPRAWVKCAKMLAYDKYRSGSHRLAAMMATVGPPALELEAVIRLRSGMPTIQEIKNNPDTATLPDDKQLAAGFLAVSMCAQNSIAAPAAAPLLFKYIKRMGLEMQASFVTALTGAGPAGDTAVRAIAVADPGLVELMQEMQKVLQ